MLERNSGISGGPDLDRALRPPEPARAPADLISAESTAHERQAEQAEQTERPARGLTAGVTRARDATAAATARIGPASWYASTHPDSAFRREPMVARALPDGGRLTLRGDTLTLRRGEHVERTQVGSADALLAVLDERFGLRHAPPGRT